MNKNKRIRRTVILTLVLASVLFTAGAGQAMAHDHVRDGGPGAHVVITLLERIGTFVSELAVEVVEVYNKGGASPASDG